MNRSLSSFASLAIFLAANLVACNQETSSTDRRSMTPAEEMAVGTPKLEIGAYESTEAFSSKKSEDEASLPEGSKESNNQVVISLYDRAAELIKTAYAGSNNVYIASVAYSIRDGHSKTQCVYVQIQERSRGKRIAHETLTPEGQPEKCVPAQRKGLGLGSIGFLAKVAGNNYVGGLGVGAVYFDGTNLAGCAAGAAGYVSETYNATDGTYGAWCSEIVDVTAL